MGGAAAQVAAVVVRALADRPASGGDCAVERPLAEFDEQQVAQRQPRQGDEEVVGKRLEAQAQLDDVAGHQRGDADCGLPPVAQDRCVVADARVQRLGGLLI